MIEIGIEAEFAALFAVAALGSSFFDKFEVETPTARKLLRWIIAAAATLGAYAMIGHWALAVLGLRSKRLRPPFAPAARRWGSSCTSGPGPRSAV